MKITIRPATLEDYPAAQKLHSLPGVIRGTLQLPYPSSELWKQRLSNLQDRNKFFLVATVEDEVLGMLADSSRQARRALCSAPLEQGKP